jgi:hypothetical protein
MKLTADEQLFLAHKFGNLEQLFGEIWQLSRQFHQHYTRAFFVRIFRQSQNVTRKSCRNDIRTKNSYVKTLMKLSQACKIQKSFKVKKCWSN